METVLIDFSNEHGETLKNILQRTDISFICEFILNIEEIPAIIEKHKRAIYCVPIAWDKSIPLIQETLQKYSGILIAAYDEELSEPGSFADIVATYPITWIGDHFCATGTSAACLFKTYKEALKYGWSEQN